jgi:hypothetical protein
MKIQTFILDNEIIDLSVNFLGLETIYINNQEVSSRWSVFGTIHDFEFENNRYYIKTGFGIFGIAIDVSKNGLTVIQSNRQGGILIVIAFIMILIEILYKLWNSLQS